MPERRIRQIERMLEELVLEMERGREPVPSPRHWWTRLWRGFVAASRKSVILTVRSAAGATLIVVAGFFALQHKTQLVADLQVRNTVESAEQTTYANGIAIYTTSVIQRTLCTDSVAASLRNRGQWEVAVAQLRAANLDAAADALEAGPLLAAPPRNVEECPVLAKLPINPKTGHVPLVDPVTLIPLPDVLQPG